MAAKKKNANRRQSHAVITVPDPDRLTTAAHVEVGGTILWRCETPDYPEFDIVFQPGPTPFGNYPKGLSIPGKIEAPAVRKVTDEGDFNYSIKHHPRPGSGKSATTSGPVWIGSIRCIGCPP